MPYKDPQRKKERKKKWDKEQIARGYGRWLYARRRVRYENAERYQEALRAIAVLGGDAGDIALEALNAGDIAERGVAEFVPEE